MSNKENDICMYRTEWINKSFTRYDSFPLLSFVIYVISGWLAYNGNMWSIALGVVGSALGIILIQIAHNKKIKKLEINDIKKKPNEKKSANSSTHSKELRSIFLLVGALYAIIAGLAIAQPIINFAELNCTPENDKNIPEVCLHDIKSLSQLPLLLTSNQMLLIYTFFIEGTLMFHCGMIFLTSKAAEFAADNNVKTGFINSIIIFVEAIILFFAATSTDSIQRFLLWIILLTSLDIGWCLFNFLNVEKDKESKEKSKEKMSQRSCTLNDVVNSIKNRIKELKSANKDATTDVPEMSMLENRLNNLKEKQKFNILYIDWAYFDGVVF